MWAMANRPTQFKAAIPNQTKVRSLAGYRTLDQDFLRQITPTAEALQEAGYQTMLDPTTKEILVKAIGPWTKKAAARNGLIKAVPEGTGPR